MADNLKTKAANLIEQAREKVEKAGGFDKLDAEGLKSVQDMTKEAKALQKKADLEKTHSDLEDWAKESAGRASEVKSGDGMKPGDAKSDKDEAEAKASSLFFRVVREGKSALNRDERQFLRKQLEKKALVEDSTGEILVPEAVEAEIYRDLPALTIMRGLASKRGINTNRIRRKSLTEVTVGWGKIETGNPAAGLSDFESDTVPSEAWSHVENLYGLTKAGEDELADEDAGLQAFFADSFARAIAEAEDTAFIVGTGHANNQPNGILNDGDITRVPAGQDDSAEVDDFKRLVYALPAQYRRRASFIMSSDTELNFLALKKDTTDNYLWQPSVQAGRPNTFLGYSIHNQEDVPTVGDAGAPTSDDVAIFADYAAGYRILDRAGMTMKRLEELYAEDDLIGFKVKKRVGGDVVRENAFRVLEVPNAA